MHDAPVPNWRNAGSEPAEPSGSTRAWQAAGPAPAEASGGPSRRGVKRVLAAVFLVSFAVGIGVLLYMLRHIPPTGLVLVGSGYEKNLLLPHNVYGWNGLKKLEEASDRGGFFRGGWAGWFSQPNKVRLVGDPLELNKDVGWKEAWKKIAKQIENGPQEEKTVVIAISMHGMAEGNEAYLLRNVPDVQSPDSFDQSRVKFRDVLDSLRTLKNKDIVLLLDVCHVQTHWPIGMLQNDFVATLKKTYEKEIAESGNLTIICSTSPEQISWPSEEMQTTLFAHYVVEALAGAGRPENENVTAGTLFKFVADNVSSRAKIERAREQLPILLGGADAERLAQDVSLVHVEAPPAPKPPEARPFADSDLASLQTEWNTWKTLKTERAPYVYAPHLWRLYQDTLLRYEQLLRAGDPTGKAHDLKKDLAGLHQNLLDAKAFKAAYKCVGNNFPIHRVLGFHWDNEVSDEVLRGYFAGDPDNRGLVLARYSPPEGTRYVLGRLGRLIWDDLCSPVSNLKPAEARARLAEIGKDLQLTHRPVEVQLLKMLADADPRLDPGTARLALRVRSFAEETALSVPAKDDRGELYAEVIFQRIKDKVEYADKLRRQGEDLLFGTAEHARKAQAKLKEADAAYADARIDADQLRRALALRDELAADLPFLAAWLAALPSRDDDSIEKLRLSTQDLGSRLAALNRTLGDEQKMPAPEDTNEARRQLKFAADKHQAICVDLEKKVRASLQQDWHAIDAALRVPPLDVHDETDVVKVRIGLLSGERGISGKLHLEKEASGKTETEKREDRLDLQQKMLAACLAPYGENPDGKLAEQAREFFLKLPAAIKAADGADDEKKLLAAVECCRGIPGGLVDPLKNELTEKRINPAERLRRLRTYQLLQWLAQRALDDHWFDTPDATYYGPSAAAYFDSARSLFDKDLPKAWINDEKELKAKLAKAGLAIVDPPNPNWTSEIVFPMEWRVQADPAVPEGTPMVWLDIKPKAGKGAPASEERLAVVPWPTPTKPYAASFPLKSNQPIKDGDVVVVNAIYRGQHLTQPLALRRPAPDLIIHHPPAPEKVRFAVRMDSGFDYGAVSIVLDNSGSMKTLHPKKNPKDPDQDAKPGETSRYDFALKAVEEVLQKIPDRTQLSILAFGGEITTEPIMVHPPAPWRKGTLDYWKDKLAKLPMNNTSPIAKAINLSMEKGFPTPFYGPRAIVVLTDGMDNSSFDAKDKKANTRSVQRALKQANEDYPNVEVIVVCFIEPDDEEFADAKEQFGYIDNFGGKSKFVTQAKGAALGATIEEILRPRVQLLRDGKATPGFAGGRKVNYPGDSVLEWEPPVPADNYRATILRSREHKSEIKMPRGHDIFAVLKRGQETLFLERGILGQQPEVADVAGENRKEESGWLMSLLENHVSFNERDLSQLLCFEKAKVEDAGVIQQTHPGFVWMELADSKGQKPEHALVWGKEWSTPAAAFRLKAREWGNEKPKLAAWFWPDLRENFVVAHPDRPKLVTQREEDVNDQGSLLLPAKTPARLPIESVIWEPGKTIDTPSGDKQVKDCIVVRFRYPKGKPIFIDMIKERDGPEVGSVHLYYSDAGKGTACFFGPARPTTVKLVAIEIEEFKKAAKYVDFAPRREFKAPTTFVRAIRD